jgi:hypothetical protein
MKRLKIESNRCWGKSLRFRRSANYMKEYRMIPGDNSHEIAKAKVVIGVESFQ